MKVLYCAGEQARVVLDVLDRCDDAETVVLVDDDPATHGTRVAGRRVVGGADFLAELDAGELRCLVAFGKPGPTRIDITRRLQDDGYALFSAVDPTAVLSTTATVGEGVTVNAGSYVGPGASLGDAVLVDSVVAVSHDVTLGPGATVTPNSTLAGGVTVGRGAYVGAGATVVDHTSVGENAVVGAGAVVVDDVPPGETVVGVPAEPV